MRVITEDPIRNEKGYLKKFTGSIALIILGIILLSIGSLVTIFGDPQTQEEAVNLAKAIVGLIAISKLLVQLGMALFSLFTFLGAVGDKSLSGELRRGMAVASALGILALGLSMVSLISYPYY